jgi:uncharacterized membrane protein (UPF0127 family)
MPWSIKKKDGKFCVVEDNTGDTVKCHPTREDALKHQRALYVNVPEARPKAADWEAAMAHLVDEFETQHPFRMVSCRLEPAGKTYTAAVADTDETRARGMIGQTFDQFDAMLFAYDTDVRHAFHMDGVTEQLYIAFFDADGKIVDHLGMFRRDPYHYRPERSFRYALELPAVDGDQSGSPWSWLEGQTLHIEELT